ncbi:S-layer homology domain-containing protein [Paenibacillus albidus]|uniref:S-layer homology domain-containing protein n=1 Tax=Paenibacillus albidus TaxID=2041023 RepID=UPI001BEC74C4|nr:S-layer homology domain-containing protein [Paenibacillus albidus]MBT2289192.1 S-layer homology domain-containing protein [Paenibacillus albidus]
MNRATLFLLFISILASTLQPAGLILADTPHPDTLVIEDFEHNLSDNVLVQKRNFSGAMSLESDPRHVRSGLNSVRMDYDYIGIKENPSYIYVGPAAPLTLTGIPQKIGMWVYGNNDGHLIFSKFRDGNGKSFEVEYLDPDVGVNWTGWKYIEGDIPQDKVGPIKLEIYMRIEQSVMDKKNKGTVWVDDIRLVYEQDPGEDMGVPSLEMMSPGNEAQIDTQSPHIQLLAADTQSGIDPGSVQLSLNGHPVEAKYEAATGLISYQPSAALAGGYHTVQAAVYDMSGNPAGRSSTFFIREGIRYQLEGPSEVISNTTFQLKLQVKAAADLKDAYAQLNYDPQTLEITSADPAVDPSLVAQNEIDPVQGQYQIKLAGLGHDSLPDDGTLVQLNMAVKPSAKMERGELFKSITMNDGSFRMSVGEAVYALAPPHPYKIGFPYVLSVKGSSLHTPSTLRVTDAAGTPVEGVSVTLPNPLQPQYYAKVKTAQTPVYTNADSSSVLLSSAVQGEQFLSNGVISGEYTAVYLPDGKTVGWIASAELETGLLTEGWGLTDANGEIRTPLTTLALTSLDLQAVNGDKVSKVFTLNVVPQLGADKPEYVRTFVTEDMKSTLSIVWRTAPRVEQGVIQYVQASDFAGFDQPNIQEQAAEPELLMAPDRVGETLFHKGKLLNLLPGTEYRYRVGSPDHWSETFTFRTEAAAPDAFSFLFVTDSHTNNEEAFHIHQNLMSNAFAKYPDARFVMHGGDIVDDGGKMMEWEQDMKAAQLYSGNVPSAYTIGNHDVKNGGKQVFTTALGLPGNGMKDQEHLTYSYDYEDTHFVVLNSEADEVDMQKQAVWLRDNLEASTKKWKVAMFHRPAYHTEDGRGPELVSHYLAPVLEELGVDLVLVGHDHALAWTYPMKKGQPLKDGSPGTVYLAGGSSGWKFYDAVKHDYLNYLYDDNFPVYSAININKDRILIEAIKSDGQMLQALTITKPKALEPDPEPTPGTSPSPAPGTSPSPAPGTSPSPAPGASPSPVASPSPSPMPSSNPGVGTGYNPSPSASSGPAATPSAAPSNPPAPVDKPQPALFIGGVKTEALKDAFKIRLAEDNQPPASAAFTDIADLWSSRTISIFLQLQVINGYGDGTFRPNHKITRGEFAQVVTKVFGLTATDSPVDLLKDTEAHWAKEAIAILSSNGIISGYPDGTFKPDREISRAEIVLILSRIVNFDNAPALESKVVFSDTVNSRNKELIAKATQMGLIQGQGNGKFAPEQAATRAEALTILMNALCLDPELKTLLSQFPNQQ